ncbi:hypothetical protein FZN17_24595 [Escherichia coli]|nr:hypothetical protein [Escherichia coli]NAQ76971.1 hypothetical protein [Escherichia coli]
MTVHIIISVILRGFSRGDIPYFCGISVIFMSVIYTFTRRKLLSIVRRYRYAPWSSASATLRTALQSRGRAAHCAFVISRKPSPG